MKKKTKKSFCVVLSMLICFMSFPLHGLAESKQDKNTTLDSSELVEEEQAVGEEEITKMSPEVNQENEKNQKNQKKDQNVTEEGLVFSFIDYRF